MFGERQYVSEHHRLMTTRMDRQNEHPKEREEVACTDLERPREKKNKNLYHAIRWNDDDPGKKELSGSTQI